MENGVISIHFSAATSGQFSFDVKLTNLLSYHKIPSTKKCLLFLFPIFFTIVFFFLSICQILLTYGVAKDRNNTIGKKSLFNQLMVNKNKNLFFTNNLLFQSFLLNKLYFTSIFFQFSDIFIINKNAEALENKIILPSANLTIYAFLLNLLPDIKCSTLFLDQ